MGPEQLAVGAEVSNYCRGKLLVVSTRATRLCLSHSSILDTPSGVHTLGLALRSGQAGYGSLTQSRVKRLHLRLKRPGRCSTAPKASSQPMEWQRLRGMQHPRSSFWQSRRYSQQA